MTHRFALKRGAVRVSNPCMAQADISVQEDVRAEERAGSESPQRSRGGIFSVCLTAAVYLGCLLAVLGLHGFDAGWLVHAGQLRVDASRPIPLPVAPKSFGYDGQFFYALACDPALSGDACAIVVDIPAYRQQRILYPVLVHALSMGNPDLFVWMMPLLNLLSVCLLAWVAQRYVRNLGAGVALALALSLYPGFIFSTLHDLPEPIACTLILAAFLCLRERRWAMSSALLCMAVLTRETSALAVGAILIATVGRLLTRKPGAQPIPLYVSVVPLALLAMWQLALYLRWGHLPATEGSDNLGLPLTGLFGMLKARNFAGTTALLKLLLDLAFITAFACLGVCGLIRLRSNGTTPPEKLAFVFYGGLALLLSTPVWEFRGGFLRALSEFYIFAVIAAAGRSKHRTTRA